MEFVTAVLKIIPGSGAVRDVQLAATRGQPFPFAGHWWESTSVRQLRSGAILLTVKSVPARDQGGE